VPIAVKASADSHVTKIIYQPAGVVFTLDAPIEVMTAD